MQDYQHLNDNSKVWIYQSTREFDADDTAEMNQKLKQFTHQWTSHNQALKAFGKVYHNRFVVLMVDETLAGASGCSIDKSVHFLKYMEVEMSTNFFDRLNLAYFKDDKVHIAHTQELPELYENGTINDEVLFFDNLVKNKHDFQHHWLKPLAESWHKRLV